MIKQITLLAVSTLALAACQDQASGGGGSRNEIRIVGSSTVYPFAKAVAEKFASEGADRVSPILESTGTGGGMDQFCKGVGAEFPDITNASRRIKISEFEKCQANGVTDIVELKVGIDGLALGQAKNGPDIKLTPKEIYEALAANPYGKPNTTKMWSDVNPALPKIAISVYGPPTTSGTRDALAELILEAGCKTDEATKALKKSDKDKYKAVCHEVRVDGPYIDSGENDNLIVQKLTANPNSVGVFGYSYLEENSDNVRGININGVAPAYDVIASGEYPGARPLFVYLKKAHVGVIPGIQEFATEFTRAGGKDDYLSKEGLISSPDALRQEMADRAKNMTPMNGDELK